MNNLTAEERNQLKKLIKGTNYVPPGLSNKPEIVKEFKQKRAGPVIVSIKDSSDESMEFELISVRKTDGFYGKPIEISVNYIQKLSDGTMFYPWIQQIVDDRELIFPYYHGKTDLVIFSPILILAQNVNYIKDEIDPYNVPISAFLLLFNPKIKKLFLEAVSRTIVGNVALIENIMLRNNELYDRGNHVKNWLYYFLLDGKKKTKLQIFSMRQEFTEKYQKYLQHCE
ncbi:MAG: hypothetical protein ACTSVY_11330 [Candidatus Helarchaeota archaeon]